MIALLLALAAPLVLVGLALTIAVLREPRTTSGAAAAPPDAGLVVVLPETRARALHR